MQRRPEGFAKNGQEIALSGFSVEQAASLGGPEWLLRSREEAAERFLASELPTESEESWRYSRIGELDLDRFSPAPPAAEPPRLPGWLEDALRALGKTSATVLSDGVSVQSVEVLAEAEDGGLSVSRLSEAKGGRERLARQAPSRDCFVELSRAFCADPLAIEVAAGSAVADPVVVVHWIDPAPLEGSVAAVFPRTFVDLGAGARAQVVEIVASSAQEVLVVPEVSLSLGEGGQLDYVSLQLLGPNAWQLATHDHSVAAGASLRSFSMSLGGDYARLSTDSALNGPGADSKLLAGYFARGGQVLDFRTRQEHAAPSTTSDLLFKGAVADKARSVYTGLIHIQHGARGSNAFQTNRNIVLSDGAHADSVPNLDIEENDVRCSHASAVGPLDPEQIYYLETRGISTEIARRLVVMGFFRDVIERNPVAGLRELLDDAVATRLGESRGEVVASMESALSGDA